MAYENGTATNVADLYAKFITFMTTALGVDNWVMVHGYEHADTTVTGAAAYVTEGVLENKIILKGPGASGGDEIYVGLSTYRDAGSDRFAFQGRAYRAFDNTKLWDNQPFQSVATPCILLWDQLMDYWFIGSGRRFIMVVKVNSTYQVLYGGFILPYAFPTEYQYPYLLGGTSNLVTKGYHNVDVSNCCFWDGYIHNSVINLPTNSWKYAGRTENPAATSPSDYGYDNSISFAPYYIAGASNTDNVRLNPLMKLKPAFGGEYILYPIEPCSALSNETVGLFGALDGIHAVSGFGNAPENTALIDGKNYVIFNNVNRVDTQDYFAVRID